MYLVEEDFLTHFHLRMILSQKLDCNPTYKKTSSLDTSKKKRRGVYSAASGEDIVTFKSSSSNGDIVPNTVRALKGHLCELLGYNRFRQTLLTSDGVARTQDFFFAMYKALYFKEWYISCDLFPFLVFVFVFRIRSFRFPWESFRGENPMDFFHNPRNLKALNLAGCSKAWELSG